MNGILDRYGPDGTDRRIEAALARLPQWKPPEDFGQRLAAAAYRQQELQRMQQPAIRAGLLLQRITRATLVVLVCLVLAAGTAFLVPWGEVAARGMSLLWLCVAVLFSYSVVLTWRVLRLDRTAMRIV